MSFHSEQCNGPACGRRYLVEQFNRAVGEGRRPGILVCPHCGAARAGDPELVYVTAPMLPEDEGQVEKPKEHLARQAAFPGSCFCYQWETAASD